MLQTFIFVFILYQKIKTGQILNINKKSLHVEDLYVYLFNKQIKLFVFIKNCLRQFQYFVIQLKKLNTMRH